MEWLEVSGLWLEWWVVGDWGIASWVFVFASWVSIFADLSIVDTLQTRQNLLVFLFSTMGLKKEKKETKKMDECSSDVT